ESDAPRTRVVEGQGESGESADHVALDHEVVGAAGRCGSLREQRPVHVAVIGGWFPARAGPITLGPGPGHERSQRARALTRPGLPVEAVLLAFGAPVALGELEDPFARMVSGVVLALRVDVGKAHLYRGKLVAADATEEDLVVSGIGVPGPARAVGYERDGKGEVVLARIQHDLASAALDPVSAIVVRDEPLEGLPIGDAGPGLDERTPLCAEDLDERLSIDRADRSDQRVDRVVDGFEALLRARRERGSIQAEHDREREHQAPHRR